MRICATGSCSLIQPTMPSVTAMKSPSPPASPSNPSMRLMMFGTAMSQKTVIGHAPRAELDAPVPAGIAAKSMLSPILQTSSAIKICPANFFLAPSGLKSSHSPSPHMSSEPSKTGNHSVAHAGSRARIKIRPTESARMIGMPPRRGIFPSWRLRVSFASSRPMEPRFASSITHGVVSTAMQKPKPNKSSERSMRQKVAV